MATVAPNVSRCTFPFSVRNPSRRAPLPLGGGLPKSLPRYSPFFPRWPRRGIASLLPPFLYDVVRAASPFSSGLRFFPPSFLILVVFLTPFGQSRPDDFRVPPRHFLFPTRKQAFSSHRFPSLSLDRPFPFVCPISQIRALPSWTWIRTPPAVRSVFDCRIAPSA